MILERGLDIFFPSSASPLSPQRHRQSREAAGVAKYALRKTILRYDSIHRVAGANFMDRMYRSKKRPSNNATGS